MKIKITPTQDIGICGDGCCHADEWMIEKDDGNMASFPIDANEDDMIELITFLIPESVIEVENYKQ